MGYELIAYRPELAPQIAQLQTYLWSEDPVRNAAYLQWKYTENPYLDRILMRLALADGRVVAMRGLFGTMWQVDDPATRFLLPYADDFVVAPEHRNRGVAHLVMQGALDEGARAGFPFALSLSAGTVTFVSSLATGWRSAGSYQSALRTRPATLVERGARRARRLLGRDRIDVPRPERRAGGVFARLDQTGEGGAGRVSLRRDPRPVEMAGLVDRLPWDGRLRHVRDAAYLRWRFRNPLHEYRFLFWDDGGLQGYLVLQRARSARADQGAVNLVDWEATDEGVRAALLSAALDWGRFDRVHIWTCGLDESIAALLQRHGFANAPSAGVRSQRGLLVRQLGATEGWTLGSRSLLNIAEWDLRMLYSMAG